MAWRIPCFYAPGRRIVLLTVFLKQRMKESIEVGRAPRAMNRCIDEDHTAKEDSLKRITLADLKNQRLE